MVLPVMVVGVASLLRIPVEPPVTVLPVMVAPVEPADTSMPGPLAGRTVLDSITVSVACPTTMMPPWSLDTVEERMVLAVPEWTRIPAPLLDEVVTFSSEFLFDGIEGWPGDERLALIRNPTPPLLEDTVSLMVVPVQPRFRLKPWLLLPVDVEPVIVAPTAWSWRSNP